MKLTRKPEAIEQDITDNNRIGANLYKIRYLAFLSQGAFAERVQLAGLDIDRATISLIEHGKRKLLAYEMPYFAKALNLTMADFVEKLFAK